ncbi:uncharacterized protein LOC107462518 [Arachis duranensis]|uniref:Uncharacterized protein LOC107462518 n=1 Tax=Arachis duranensis TaxID=130453 RepID=A0A6P4B5I7_ARADU|nr:uncharacterized protein LOC107462518 [Arachis duranensis]
MRHQHGMPLDDRIVLYLQMAGLYYLARLNETWFRLDEPLVERWRPEMHTFHMPFGECTITLQDVTYQLGLPIDATPGAQPTIKSVLQSKEIVEKCDIAIARWMMDASVPFNAVNSAYYQSMIDAIANMGAWYKGPNYEIVRGYLLSKLVEDVKKMIEDYRVIWKQTGCTIMADGWTDRCRRTLINFLVYCPKGTVFLKSVDAYRISKTTEALFKLLKDVVLFVGLENVVHIVTDNAANYLAAGRLSESEFRRLCWSPCVAHCVNLMLQDIGKQTRNTSSSSNSIRHFFIALQSILAQKDALRAMVTSREWRSSAYSKEVKAKKFVDQVLDSKFWNQCTDIVKLIEPLVRVLRIVDSEDRAAMSFLYQAIYKVMEEMVKRFQKRKRVVDPYLKILDSQFEKHKQTTSGLLDVIERYAYGDADMISKLTSETRIFKNAEGDFGRQSAIRDRSTVMPDQWWESYGCGASNLQKLVIRVLSQSCSSSGCERNWSIFEHIHSKKRNRLEHQKLIDLVYEPNEKAFYDPICLDAFEDHLEWIMEDSPPFLTPGEVNSLRNDLANMSLQLALDDLDQLNLEDDRDDDEANNNYVENANETNPDVAPDLSDEERHPDFEITP